MTPIRAIVVGIDRYDYPGWNVAGPVSAAQSVAQWLLSLTDVTLELDVFLSPDVEIDQAIQEAAEQLRFRLHRTTTAAAFDTFTRKTMLASVADGTHLFVYWCGHGVTCGASGDRVLMCADFDEDLESRVFNASEFIKSLRTQKYSVFDSQLLLIDACGEFETKQEFHQATLVQLATLQLAYFASQPGHIAKSPAAGGIFTQTALDIFREVGGYPTDLDAVDTRLSAALRALRCEPFCIASLSKKVERPLFAVGLPPGDPVIHRYVQSALDLIGELDIVSATCRTHYVRTVADFGNPAYAAPNDVPGMLKDLCGMGNRLSPGDMSEALLQFMERLAALPELKEAVAGWLDRDAPTKRNTRKEIRTKLDLERRSKTLLFIVRDDSRQIVAMRPYLCLGDGSPDQSYQQQEILCTGWTAFVSAVQTILEHFVVDGYLPNLQIQFAVEPFLMDRPFHQIPVAPAGRDLGSMAPVVLRHRTRLQSPDPKLREDWTTYMEALRRKSKVELQWLRVDIAKELPQDTGFCFTGFSVPNLVSDTSSSASQKEVLWRLMQLGAPVVYVRHADPGNGNWEGVADFLKTMSTDSRRFDNFVHSFYRARLSQTPDASQATLLWDDPGFNPFGFLLS